MEIKTNKPKICNLLIVDASGSMYSKKEDVVGSLKELLKEIQGRTEVDQHVVITEFSDTCKSLLNCNSKNIETYSIENYKPQGNTALYDAIGESFKLVPDDCTNVLVNILTDGEENASTKYSQLHIKDLITEKSKQSWVVTFLGTTQEAALSAQNLGISKGNTVLYSDTSAGNKLAASARSRSMDMFYNAVNNGNATSDAVTMNLMNEAFEEVSNS